MEKKDKVPTIVVPKQNEKANPHYSVISHIVAASAAYVLGKLGGKNPTPLVHVHDAFNKARVTRLPDENDDQLSIYGSKSFPGKHPMYNRKG